MPAKRKTKKKFSSRKEVRAIARERVGTVPPARVIVPKSDRQPRHKVDPSAVDES